VVIDMITSRYARMSVDVDAPAVARLAPAMTWKFAAI
jgi:hypothetical protein